MPILGTIEISTEEMNLAIILQEINDDLTKDYSDLSEKTLLMALSYGLLTKTSTFILGLGIKDCENLKWEGKYGRHEERLTSSYHQHQINWNIEFFFQHPEFQRETMPLVTEPVGTLDNYRLGR